MDTTHQNHQPHPVALADRVPADPPAASFHPAPDRQPGPTVSGPGIHPSHGWVRGYLRCMILTEIGIITGVAFASQTLRFDDDPSAVVDGAIPLSYWFVSGLLAAGWILALRISGAYDPEVACAGPSELRPVLRGTFFYFGLVAILSFLLDLQVARGYLALALPLGLAGLIASRFVWHSVLGEYRRMGSHLETVVVIGGRASAVALAARLQARSTSGYRVAGLCIPTVPGADPVAHPPITDFPVLGTLDDALDAVRRTGAGLVAIAGSEQIGPEEVRGLAWALEGTGVRLALAPSVAGVAGPRIRVRRIADLPLMQVDEPIFSGPKLIAKNTLDFTVALAALLVLSPLLLVVALVIKLADRGPVFFRHERVGLGGRRFHVLKFRSMTPQADKRIGWARQATGQDDAVFFKAADDPRITPIGRFIRHTSIDEIPQLLNVLAGQMSIVGPRPLVPGEGATIRSFVERRMLVKPGITGLWQVSGRSALSEDERIRLDFYYVENWSLSGDLVLMARTVSTVLAGKGAY